MGADPRDATVLALEPDGAPAVPEALQAFWEKAAATTTSKRGLEGIRWRLAGLSWAEAGGKVGLSHTTLIQLAHRTGLMAKMVETGSMLELKRHKVLEADMEILRRLRDPEALKDTSIMELNALSGTDTDKLFASQKLGFASPTGADSPFERIAQLIANGEASVTVTLSPTAPDAQALDVTPTESSDV